MAQPEVPQDTLGGKFPPSCSASGRCGIASQGTKELVGTTALPNPLSMGQKQLLRVANLDSGFLLCFTLNSIFLSVGTTALLGQTSTSSGTPRPSSRGPVQSMLHQAIQREIVHSSLRASWTVAGMNSPLQGLGRALAPFFSPYHQHRRTSVTSTVPQGRPEPLSPSPTPLHFLTRVNVPENQSSGLLPKKTSTNSLHALSLLTIECCKISA